MLRVIEESRRRSAHPRANRVLVFGAGEAGHQAVKAIREDPTSDLLPVAFLDDDPARARLKVAGMPVAGDRGDIAETAKKYEAGGLVIAMPSAERRSVLEIADTAQNLGLSVRILPPMDKFLTEPVAFRDIRELTLADFLSRDEIELDDEKIRGYLSGKIVLVTGAGGSIGAQLCETVRTYGPSRLLMLDHAENSLHALQLRLDGRALLDNPELILADIREIDSLRAVFREHRPDVVFHAAAHKHVTFLERHPIEAVKTNVFGVENVLRAAVESGVERFVNVSTDKAADPINVLGLTKRIGERLTAHYATRGEGVYMSVRFGNVLGSNGSVIPTFRDQIARGEPITVTHPDVTRYFMTIPEAVQLVLQAGAVGHDGDVLVLDMGQPVKIVDLAHRLAAEIDPGSAPTIVYTGLRPGEKLHEVLINEKDEPLDRPHELLLRYRVAAVEPDEVHTFLDHTSDPIAAMEKLTG
jgi:FlaA1/EpsC-like NDP-sugar epimerase